jgi:ABC-type dipeptide/oligopeptide/nickel transport system permease subunit
MKVRLPMLLMALLVLGASLTLTLSRYGYSFQDRDAIQAASSPLHWSGTDELGRDRTVRVAAALLIGLTGASLAGAITTLIAAAFGLLAAFSNRAIAALLIFVSDVFLSLPWLFLLMMARSLMPLTASPLETVVATFLVLALLGWPACARAVYSGALNLRNAEWMIQGHACGLRKRQLLRMHLLPHLRPLLLPQFLICLPAFLIAEANLGALGLGIGEPLPSWGAMLMEMDNSAMLMSSHWVYLPIILLVIVLLILESISTQVEPHA